VKMRCTPPATTPVRPCICYRFVSLFPRPLSLIA
jgi:hypothetical protein